MILSFVILRELHGLLMLYWWIIHLYFFKHEKWDNYAEKLFTEHLDFIERLDAFCEPCNGDGLFKSLF